MKEHNVEYTNYQTFPAISMALLFGSTLSTNLSAFGCRWLVSVNTHDLIIGIGIGETVSCHQR
jgi:hypothetical protein